MQFNSVRDETFRPSLLNCVKLRQSRTIGTRLKNYKVELQVSQLETDKNEINLLLSSS